jgi:hypothetical protein
MFVALQVVRGFLELERFSGGFHVNFHANPRIARQMVRLSCGER